MSLEDDLRRETEKWLLRAQEAMDAVSAQGVGGARFSANIEAYISDSRYFLEKGDLIRAFEAVIWAWAWIEISQDLGILISERKP